jgi:hypothetical protein
MLIGYIGSGYPIIWGDKVKMGFLLGGKEGEALTGMLKPTDQIPSFKCSDCGIIISQYK